MDNTLCNAKTKTVGKHTSMYENINHRKSENSSPVIEKDLSRVKEADVVYS